MRVGLNAEPLFQRVPTGVGVYALALCRGLVEIGHANDLVLFHADHDEAPPEVDALPVNRVANDPGETLPHNSPVQWSIGPGGNALNFGAVVTPSRAAGQGRGRMNGALISGRAATRWRDPRDGVLGYIRAPYPPGGGGNCITSSELRSLELNPVVVAPAGAAVLAATGRLARSPGRSDRGARALPG